MNFLFPFVSYRRIFNLEMQNFSLENHHMNACQPLCWWITFTKVSNPFLPSPPKWLTWPLDDCGGVGYGWFYWFSLYWRRFFFQTSLELEFFSPTYNGVKFIFQHCTSWAIFFFSAGQSPPRALRCMQRREIKSSGEPWSKIVSDWFQQKTIKVFLIGPFKFARERLNVRRVWRASGFFTRNVEVNTTGRFLISAIPKQHLHD